MKILFILPNAGIGGVERVRLVLIKYLISKGHECHLVLRRATGQLLDEAKSLVKIHEIAPRNIYQFIPNLTKIIQNEQPTHVVSAFSDVGVLTWLALRASKAQAAWVHSVDNTHSYIAARKGLWGHIRHWIDNRFSGFIYRHATAIIAVSHGVQEEVIKFHKVTRSRVVKIFNPTIPDDLIKKCSNRTEGNFVTTIQLVSIGRLVKQKGFDILIRSMENVRGNWELNIWGAGPEKPRLASLIRNLELGDRIHLRGYTDTPLKVLIASDIYIMPSRHEGLGGTLIEAMGSGCQLIATDCMYGPREILLDGELGQLVPIEDIASMSTAISRAINRSSYVPSSKLRQRAKDFMWSRQCAAWERLLYSVQRHS